MRLHFALSWLLTVLVAGSLPAAVIGTNTPALPLTPQRTAALPPNERAAWTQYLDRSAAQMRADKGFLDAEMREHGLKESLPATPARAFGRLRLDEPDSYYTNAQTRRYADIVVSFQTPAGGWSKRLDMSRQPRAPGQRFDGDSRSRFLGANDNDSPSEGAWSYVGTFDNGATTTQLRFLARVISANLAEPAGSWSNSFVRGLEYIFQSQYPNGGWPQVWPLAGGYHDAITYNDGAIVNILELLREVSAGRDEYAFVPAATRARAEAGLRRGVECILATQIVTDGRRTVWCQQHDVLTLQPTSARNYEMPNQTSAESAGILLFLMKLPKPDPQVIAAVNAGVAWLEQTQIKDFAYKNTGGQGRLLVAEPGHGPIWARYYGLDSHQPIFGDRDKSILDDVSEVSEERRRGYGWFTDSPARVLEEYPEWRERVSPDEKPKTDSPAPAVRPAPPSPRDS